MIALVCDICGGKLTMGSGGIAVCDSCGMEHAKERMKEKVQEIKGVVRVDNSHMIENYLSMAQNAYDSSNKGEAESYCNKIIEIDPNNYQAWLLKGKSAGWQSTLEHPRFSEMVSCFSQAIVNAPEDKRDEIIEHTKEELTEISVAMISLRSERFVKYPDKEETQGFSNDISYIITAAKQYNTSISAKLSSSELFTKIAVQIGTAVINAMKGKISTDYSKSNDGYASDNAFRTYVARAGYCSDLLKMAINLSNNDEANHTSYSLLVIINNTCINACSYEYKTVQAGYSFFDGSTIYANKYVMSLQLADNAKALRIKENEQYRLKMTEIENRIKSRAQAEMQKQVAEAKARIAKYWEDHADEKAKLDAESQYLAQQIAALNAEINNVTSQAEITNIQNRISKLKADKGALSIFKGKEKKAVQELIDIANVELENVQSRRNSAIAEIQHKIAPLERRKAAIAAEFTKDR